MSRDQSDGFTLIEVLVAALLVATVVANVAALCAIATRAAHSARTRTNASRLALQKMEQLQALVWATDEGAPYAPASDLTSDLSVEPATAAGRGLSPSPAGTLVSSTAGYADYLDASGQWVGAGPTPPVAAVYLRRWSIDPLPSDPSNVLVLQVFVTTVAANARRPPGRTGRDADDALVVDLKTRRAR